MNPLLIALIVLAIAVALCKAGAWAILRATRRARDAA
jgi:hypothetical protein